MEVLKDSDPDYEGKQGTNKDQTARVLIREVLIPRTAAERKFAEEFHSPILNWDSPTLAQKTQYGHLAERNTKVCTSANRALCLSLLSSKRVAAFFEPAGRRCQVMWRRLAAIAAIFEVLEAGPRHLIRPTEISMLFLGRSVPRNGGLQEGCKNHHARTEVFQQKSFKFPKAYEAIGSRNDVKIPRRT
ncbi:hypothetical protein AK812_SmicGene40887, partial [Symbiodinium microadriaticum]